MANTPVTTGNYDPSSVDLSFDFASVSAQSSAQQGQGTASLISPEVYGAASSMTMPAPMVPVTETDTFISDIQSI